MSISSLMALVRVLPLRTCRAIESRSDARSTLDRPDRAAAVRRCPTVGTQVEIGLLPGWTARRRARRRAAQSPLSAPAQRGDNGAAVGEPAQDQAVRRRVGLAHLDDRSLPVAWRVSHGLRHSSTSEPIVDRFERPAGYFLQHQRADAGEGVGAGCPCRHPARARSAHCADGVRRGSTTMSFAPCARLSARGGRRSGAPRARSSPRGRSGPRFGSPRRSSYRRLHRTPSPDRRRWARVRFGYSYRCCWSAGRRGRTFARRS